MSLSSALSNALSGLTASARGASVISSNLTNAMTEGYAARGLTLSSRSWGADGGVSVEGITRRVDQALLGERRGADAELSASEVQNRYLARISAVAGDPTDAHSLTALLAEFESTLIAAAALPESEIRLTAVADAAADVANGLNKLSSTVQSLRAEADRSVNTQVQRLNDALGEVETLNRSIIAARGQGREHAGLLDQRQALIDEISTIVPVKELPRDMGSVALVTPGGAVLLDGEAAEVSFTPRNTVAAHMTVENGLLGGLSVNGSAIDVGPDGPISGGALGATFLVRDQTLTAVQGELDTIALDLIQRFETGVDPTLPPDASGLFTDSGAVASSATGIAGRIALNATVDPSKGGEVWRLRDGLSATSPEASGNSEILQAMLDGLSATKAPATTSLGAVERDLATLFSDFHSALGLRESNAEQQTSFASARQSELKEMELSFGVDTDAELQHLLMVEQAYAANAKIIQAVDEMLQRLMEIG